MSPTSLTASYISPLFTVQEIHYDVKPNKIDRRDVFSLHRI